MVYYRHRVKERVFHRNKDKDKKGTMEMEAFYIINDNAEETLINRIFDKMVKDKEMGLGLRGKNWIGNGLDFIEDGEVDTIPMTPTCLPIIYSYHEENCTYTVFNFRTLEKFENVEGDVAGLMNLPMGNFPF